MLSTGAASRAAEPRRSAGLRAIERTSRAAAVVAPGAPPNEPEARPEPGAAAGARAVPVRAGAPAAERTESRRQRRDSGRRRVSPPVLRAREAAASPG